MTHAQTSPLLSLDELRALANDGGADLAILEGIRTFAHGGFAGSECAELLNDLAVLRHVAGDQPGALRILARAATEAPGNMLVRENLEALESLPATGPALPDQRGVNAGAANPWVVEGLHELNRSVDLTDRNVIELGGSTPPECVERFSPNIWTVADILPVGEPIDGYRLVGSDVARLAFRDERFDAAFSVCAFEHFDDISGALDEVHRVLRPGAHFFTQFSPIWSCAVGHHVWVRDADDLLTFNDMVIPDWAHLVLSEGEMLAFLSLTLDKSMAERAASFVYRSRYLNRRFEAEFRRAFESCRFEIVSRSAWGGRKRPSAILQAELERRWPEGGDFGVYGTRVLLRKLG